MSHSVIAKKPKILVIVGPTAIGKTALSVVLAKKFDAEIISADSRQIFRHMNICTAKPMPDEMQGVPHHFIDHIDPDQYYSAGQFGVDGRKVIGEIFARGRKVIVCGGSGLYIRSLIDGFMGEAEKDDSIRAEIRERISRHGLESVYQELQTIDPAAAARIHPNDAKRIERALEVYRMTGQKISDKHAEPTEELQFEPVMIGLDCERSELYRRIEARVDRMIDSGVIEETKQLLERGYSSELTSMESLGYREIMAYLRGEMTYERMIELFKQGSRNYAKRQLTWFRKDKRICWFDVPEKPIDELSDEILAKSQINR